MSKIQKMKYEVKQKYGKESEQYGYFCWVFSRRDSDMVEYVYHKLMER